MNEHRASAQLEEFALGMLEAGDAALVRAHLAVCAECRAEFEQLRVIIDVLPQALPTPPPPRALRGRIMAAIEAPQSDRRRLGILRGLAAALVVAVLGDATLAWRLQQRSQVALVNVPPATPSAASSTTPRARPPRAVSSPLRVPAALPAPSGRPNTVADRDATVRRLAHDLAAARAEAGTNRNRIRALERALALARATPHIVRVEVTPPPKPAVPEVANARIPAPSPAGSPEATAARSAAPSDTALVAALQTGKVYSLDGTVGSEAWHLTVVQPRERGHALVYSGTPDAPNGKTYRTWVIRAGRTVSVGELPPGQPATLEMPMALEGGDVIAFSREPVGAGEEPSSPFLMELKITP